MNRLFVLLVFLLCLENSAVWAEPTHLVLIGGGPRPAAALKQFVSWAGGAKAKILVIAWASEEPQASYDALAKDFSPFAPASIAMAPSPPVAIEKFLDQLQCATGVFFSGGDQRRIMDVLKNAKLKAALQNLYRKGVVFGGTSAGTAIMSCQMMTGDGDFTVIDGRKVDTREGLCLLPGTILDQHFLKRQRENRLFGLVLESPTLLGIGIDEGTALLVTDNRTAEVQGESQVMTVSASGKSTLNVKLLKANELFTLP
ncbi:MAG: cyanophycinase [Anaerolineae bacterium]|nr:cyanophycinase [Gloeobacterales cyanobacterium ES-bin-313]